MPSKKITCPVSAHLEEIEFIEDAATGDIVEIIECSARRNSGSVTCAQLCARRLNLGRARRASGPVPLVSPSDIDPAEDEAKVEDGDEDGDHDGGAAGPGRFAPPRAPYSA